MIFPAHPLFQLEEPLIYLEGNLFQGGLSHNPTDQDSLIYRDKTFPLEKLSPPYSFDLLFCKRHPGEFQQYQNEFIKEVGKIELHSQDDVLRKVCDNELLRLIVGKLLPKLNGNKLEADLSALLGETQSSLRTPLPEENSPARNLRAQAVPAQIARGRTPQSPRTLDRLVEQTLASGTSRETSARETSARVISTTETPVNDGSLARELIRDLKMTQNPLVTNDKRTLRELFSSGYSSFDSIFENNFFKIDGCFYNLIEVKDYLSKELSKASPAVKERVRNYERTSGIEETIRLVRSLDLEPKIKDKIEREINGLIVRYGRRHYKLQYQSDSPVVEQKLKTNFQNLLQVEAVYQYENQLSWLNERKELEKELKGIVRKREHESNGAGFVKSESGYHVYAVTGEYDVKQSNVTYHFPSAKVGVHLSSNRNGNIAVNSPVVLNHYRHPFLQGDGAGQRICLGNFSIDTFTNLPLEEKIIACISKGMEVLKYGYRHNAHPYHNLTWGAFDSYIKKK